MILCPCAGVTEETVRRTILAGADTLAEVARRCGAGRFCEPCRAEVAALLGALRSSRDNAGTDPRGPSLGRAA